MSTKNRNDHKHLTLSQRVIIEKDLENHASEIPCCRKTLYNYIDKSVFSARNIDMRRRGRYKVRKKPTRVSIMAREFRVGRTYEDFQKLLKDRPDTPVVEMDTVEGGKGKGS